jgi:tol-pal system protein YbgF
MMTSGVLMGVAGRADRSFHRFAALVAFLTFLVSGFLMFGSGFVTEARAQDLFGLGADQNQRKTAENNLRINQLEGQMRNLNGQIEQLTFQIRQLQEAMARMQKDYEFRLQEIENSTAGRRPQKKTEATPSPNDDPYASANPQRLGSAGSSGAIATAPALTTAGSQATGPGATAPVAAGSLALPQQAGSTGASSSIILQPPAPIGVPPAGIRSGPGAPPMMLGQIPAADDRSGSIEPLDPNAPPGVRLGPSAPKVAGIPGVPPRYTQQPPTANARDEYDAAYGYILNGEYELAETSFKTYLANHPTDSRVGSAQYWLGESFFARTMHKEAADAFLKSYTQYPDGPKAPDSLLKLGLSLGGLGERKAACTTFDELLAKYPKASKALRDRATVEKSRGKC